LHEFVNQKGEHDGGLHDLALTDFLHVHVEFVFVGALQGPDFIQEHFGVLFGLCRELEQFRQQFLLLDDFGFQMRGRGVAQEQQPPHEVQVHGLLALARVERLQNVLDFVIGGELFRTERLNNVLV